MIKLTISKIPGEYAFYVSGDIVGKVDAFELFYLLDKDQLHYIAMGGDTILLESEEIRKIIK